MARTFRRVEHVGQWLTVLDRKVRSVVAGRAPEERGDGRGGFGGPGNQVRGSIEKGLAEADHKLEVSYTIAYIAHVPLEPRAAVAEWKEGKLTVWTGTQCPFRMRGELYAKLGNQAKALEDLTKTPDARGATLARGDQLRPGDAVANTGARGQGFGGLSTGGGTGISPVLDVGNFCCPEYVAQMNALITANLNQHVEVPGTVIMKVTIQRDGRLTDIVAEQPSEYTALNLNARRALEITRQLPPLPPAYTNPTLTVHLTFNFKR